MQITTDTELFMRQQSRLVGFAESRRDQFSSDTDVQNRLRRTVLGTDTFTVEEAAKILHSDIPKTAIYNLIQSGRLRARMVGKKFLITGDDLKEFLTCQEEDFPHACGSDRTKVSGSSSMATSRSGQDAALRSVNRLKKLSGST